jgi:hypothetical protein
MYFGRGTYDPSTVSEAQERLRSFQGASAISSNAYFGRDEEEGASRTSGEGDGLLGEGGLANLEVAARDAVARVMANPDVQNAAESLRQGAMKVSRRDAPARKSLLICGDFTSCPTTSRRCRRDSWRCRAGCRSLVHFAFSLGTGSFGSALYVLCERWIHGNV